MKKHKRHSLKESAYRLLFEQEEETEDTGGEADTEDEVFGDDEGDADTGEAADTGDDEAGEDGEAGEEDEEVDVSTADQYNLGDSIDQELENLFVDFEEEARKSAVVNTEEVDIAEAVYRRLFESPADDIDLRDFASNVARLVKNYQNLIDWESVILNKASTFINNHYGEDTAKVLFDILESEYGIAKETQEEEAPGAPIAVGARSEGGG